MSKKYIFKYNGSKESFLTILDSFHTNNSRFYYFDDYIIEVLDDEIRFGVERAGHGGTHSCIFQNSSGADFWKNLVGQHPKPFNNFREIGCAPLVLIKKFLQF